MNRRQFLKALGVTLAALQMPIGWVEAYPNFNPKHQYGNFTVVEREVDRGIFKKVQSMFAEQIKDTIPPKYRKGISWIVQQPSPFDPRWTVAWKYSPPTGGNFKWRTGEEKE